VRYVECEERGVRVRERELFGYLRDHHSREVFNVRGSPVAAAMLGRSMVGL